MFNNKGVSLIALAITIIVIIIIAAISFNLGFNNVNHAQQAAFLTDLEEAVESVKIYGERALQYGKVGYRISELTWDGKDHYLTNSGKIEFIEANKLDPKDENNRDRIDNALDDTAQYLFHKELPITIKEKVYIKGGKLYVNSLYRDEYEWAIAKYGYMSGDTGL